MGAWVASNYEPLGHWIPMAAMLATSVLWATGPETLLPERKKPFQLAKANPIAGATILFTHGMGLRRLAIAASLFNVSTQAMSGPMLTDPGVLNKPRVFSIPVLEQYMVALTVDERMLVVTELQSRMLELPAGPADEPDHELVACRIELFRFRQRSVEHDLRKVRHPATPEAVRHEGSI